MGELPDSTRLEERYGCDFDAVLIARFHDVEDRKRDGGKEHDHIKS